MRYEDKKVEFEKVGENVNRVKLSSIYDHNCSSQEYVIVDDEMLKYLIESEMKFNTNRRTKSNHVVALPEDETAAAKMGAVVESEEEIFFSEVDELLKQKVLKVLARLSVSQRRRLYMRFRENKSYTVIGREEGLTAAAISASCIRAIKKLKKYGKILQKVPINTWLDWLI